MQMGPQKPSAYVYDVTRILVIDYEKGNGQFEIRSYTYGELAIKVRECQLYLQSIDRPNSLILISMKVKNGMRFDV